MTIRADLSTLIGESHKAPLQGEVLKAINDSREKEN